MRTKKEGDILTNITLIGACVFHMHVDLSYVYYASVLVLYVIEPYTMPWAIMALATFMNPATLAPFT